MGASQQNAGRQRESPGRTREWLSRNRDELARDVLAGLLVVGLPAAAGIILGAGEMVAIAVLVAIVAFAAGVLIARRPQQPPPAPQEPGAREMEKLTSYVEFFSPAFHLLQLCKLGDVEAELLIRPARLLEQLNSGSVRLAVFAPVETKDSEPYWHLPYVAGISGSECREFEVPLKDSHLAQMQASWEPSDKVMVVWNLQEQRWRKAGADFEAFAQAGFRMLRCFPFGSPSAEGTSRSCLMLLSKERGTFSGSDDIFLMLLGALLSIHSLMAERARLSSERGESSE